MIKYYIAVLGLLFVFSCSLNEKKCDDIKNGCFYSFSLENDTIYIIRRGDTQKEIINGTTRVFDIEWVDKCSYILIDTNKNKEVRFNVDQVNQEYYRCYANIKELPELYYDTLHFIDCK